MRYLKYTYVDSVTSILVADAPATNGPAEPGVAGLKFGFALESEYPTSSPSFYGTAPDASSIDIAGVLGELTKAEFAAAKNAEMAARDALIAEQWAAQIAARRYIAEIAGTNIDGMPIDTGRDSQGLITGAAVQAIIDPAYSLHWKTSAGFVELTGQQILGIASQVRAFVQACFNREAELLGAVADGSITAEMLEDGWPA